jgi:hypothetical protein
VAVPVEAVQSTDLTGRTVGDRYLLTGLLGRGGFGVVYAGRDLRGNGEVAVKVFSRAEGFAPRAEREARTASKLDHPNIHHCIGVEEDSEHAYLISRLVIGERFDRSDLDDEEAIRAVAAVCDALAHAHECGVVHRDVKPSNILIGDDGNVTLTDFGIARDEDARDATLDERVLGTLSYMAPEQARGEQATGATDVWAAALTLYEALTGTTPFRTKSLSDLLARLDQGAPPLTHARPDLGKAFARTVHRALDRDPRRRPDAATFRDQLLALLRTEDEEEHAPEPRPIALPSLGRLRQPGQSLLLGFVLAHTLTAFPVYPASWTLPLAVVIAALAWRSPLTGAVTTALICLPAFWNYAEGGALVYALLVGAWLASSRRSGGRMLTPLLAGPLALIGLAPLYVLIAATAPTARRRAAEALAGGLVALLWAGSLPGQAAATLPATNDPLAYAHAAGAAPALLGVLGAQAVFAVLLPIAWNFQPDTRRAQALAIWGLGFVLCVLALPTLAGSQAGAVPAATAAAFAAGIIPAAWALAASRLAFSG